MTRHVTRTGRVLKATLAGSAAALFLGLTAPHATADEGPAARLAPPAPSAPSDASRDAAHEAAGAPGTLATLSRFFAREGAVTKAAADPRVPGDKAVPVYYLSPDFVAGKKDAPVARMEFLASRAVSADGQEASLWSVRQGGSWQIVNIATGDDETHYARVGADKLPGGTVFHEPQINAWYVTKGARVLPLDKEAARAVGAEGTSAAAYQKRVRGAYGDKLPGSAYAKSGKAGGFDDESADAKGRGEGAAAPAGGSEASETSQASGADGAVTVASSVAGAGALAALGLSGVAVLRRRARRLG